MSLCPHGYSANWDCPECPCPCGSGKRCGDCRCITLHVCAPEACAHQFDGPEVPVSGDPARPMGYTTTCSHCGARAIDVHLWTLP